MRKHLFTITALLLCSILVFAGGDKPAKAPKKPTSPTVIKTVIIDPGHGGKDPGAEGLVSTEAQVSLDVALKLGKAMEAEFPEIKIIYTRATDILPGNLHDKDAANRLRAEIANKAKGDLFISIHCNSAGRRAGGWYERRVVGHNKKTITVKKRGKRVKKVVSEPIYQNFWVENKAKGTETYIWAADRSGSKASFVNETDAEGYGEEKEDSTSTLDLESPEAKLRAQLYAKYFFKNSALLGTLIEQEFQKAGRVYRGGLKQRNHKGIWVLQATGMPSVLVETGFISNKEEEEYLVSDKGQDEIVQNILDGFRQYKKQLENPVKTGGSQQTAGSSSSSAKK
jgi:N-acetylmuramoyl-L-alanine amidase